MAAKIIRHLRYAVVDTTGNTVQTFNTYKDALCYKTCVAGRFDWTIAELRERYNSTPKQRRTVENISKYLNVTFKGDINEGWDCSDFIGTYLSFYISFIKDLEGDYFDGI